MNDAREDTIDPRELVLDEAEGVLSSARDDEDLDDLETVEVLSLWQEMRRFAAPTDVRWRHVRESLGRLAAQRRPGVTRAISEWIRPSQWLADHRRLREGIEQWAESASDRGLAFDEEAMRLFRLADRWRLALLGARRVGIEEPVVERLQNEVDSEIVPAVGRDALLYCGVAPYTGVVLDLIDPDLEESDPSLFSTLDLYVAVDRAGSFEGVAALSEEPASGWQPLDWQRVAERIPREREELAAEAPSFDHPISFEWREPETSRFATMDLTADAAKEGVARLAFWEDRDADDAFDGAEACVFGIRAPVRGHEAALDLDELREAMARHHGRAPLRIRRPEGGESIWPMTAPHDERET